MPLINKEIYSYKKMPSAYYWLSRALFNVHQYMKAFDIIKISIELHPDEIDSYFMRGLIYEALGDDEKALDDYNLALSLHEVRPFNNDRTNMFIFNLKYIKAKMFDFQIKYDLAIQLYRDILLGVAIYHENFIYKDGEYLYYKVLKSLAEVYKITNQNIKYQETIKSIERFNDNNYLELEI